MSMPFIKNDLHTCENESTRLSISIHKHTTKSPIGIAHPTIGKCLRMVSHQPFSEPKAPRGHPEIAMRANRKNPWSIGSRG
ncbi:Uncharacterised protein [Bordetella pertussis]|nr:Uncharacterised protein [Bordetella pertussis]